MTITGPGARSAAPGQAVVGAAMLVLERMGLTPADLLTAPQVRPTAPTFTVRDTTVSLHLAVRKLEVVCLDLADQDECVAH